MYKDTCQDFYYVLVTDEVYDMSTTEPRSIEESPEDDNKRIHPLEGVEASVQSNGESFKTDGNGVGHLPDTRPGWMQAIFGSLLLRPRQQPRPSRFLSPA